MSLLGLVHLTIWVAAGSEFANGMLVAGSVIPARFLENPISSSSSLASGLSCMAAQVIWQTLAFG